MNELLLPTRRSLLVGLVALVAAPAIVRATSLMPVKEFERMGLRPWNEMTLSGFGSANIFGTWHRFDFSKPIKTHRDSRIHFLTRDNNYFAVIDGKELLLFEVEAEAPAKFVLHDLKTEAKS